MEFSFCWETFWRGHHICALWIPFLEAAQRLLCSCSQFEDKRNHIRTTFASVQFKLFKDLMCTLFCDGC